MKVTRHARSAFWYRYAGSKVKGKLLKVQKESGWEVDSCEDVSVLRLSSIVNIQSVPRSKHIQSLWCGVSVVMWSELTWLMRSDFILKFSDVKWVTVKFLGTKVPCTLGWPYTEGTWLYCDYFIWIYLVVWLKLFCNVWVSVCVGVLVICVLVFTVFCVVCTVFFVLFRLRLFILICFVCTSVRTTVTEWQLNCV